MLLRYFYFLFCMRGDNSQGLLFDSEIDRTTREIQKATRLACATNEAEK